MRTLAAFALGSLSVLLLGAVSGRVLSAPAAQPQDPQELAKMMEKAKKFTQPGPHHEHLKRFVGTWEWTSHFVMGGQKTPGETGTSTASWLMDGRWLRIEGQGTMMGQKFKNHILLGYDNFKQSFVMSNVSSLDTALRHAEGDMTPTGDALVMYGTLDEYLTGEHDKMVKYVYRFLSDDEFVLEVHDLPIGLENTQVMEARFQRAK